MMNQGTQNRVAALVFVAWAALSLMACRAPGRSDGRECLFSSDCNTGLVCAGRRCRAACRDDLDCVGGFRCKPSGTPGRLACMPPEEPGYCQYSSECERLGLLCIRGECARQCSTNSDCPRSAIAPLVCNVSMGLCEVGARPDATVSDAASDGAGLDAPSDDRPLPDALSVDASDSGASDDRGDGSARRSWLSLCVAPQLSCALEATGAVWCWGTNDSGELGVPSTMMMSSDRPTRVAMIAGATAIDCAGSRVFASNAVCVRTSAGSVWCWGSNSAGQLGRGVAGRDLPSDPTPTQVVRIASVEEVQLTGQSAVARTTAGQLWAWGASIGQPGESASPTRLRFDRVVRQFALGLQHLCAPDGVDLECVGSSDTGAFGVGFATSINEPTVYFDAASGGVRRAMVAGDAFSCAEVGAMGVVCSGTSANGRLGVGGGAMAPDELSPRAVTMGGMNLRAVRDLSADAASACAVTSTGSVVCWGENTLGQLGSMLGVDQRSPVVVAAVSDAEEVAVTDTHGCARRSDGAILCWGDNSRGQLGHGLIGGFSAAAEVEFR